MTASPSYDQLKDAALGSLADAAEMLDHLSTNREAAFLAQLLVAGAQVYATLAQAEAEKDSLRAIEARNPRRTTGNPSKPLSPVTNLFGNRGENEKSE